MFERFPFWSKFAKKPRFRSNFVKISILFEMCENLDFDRNFENRDFGQKVPKILILVKIFENLDLGRNFPKNLDLGRNLSKISILVEIFSLC